MTLRHFYYTTIDSHKILQHYRKGLGTHLFVKVPLDQETAK